MIINKTKLDEEISDVLKKWDYSGHVCIIKDDEVILSRDQGFSDRENNIVHNPDAPYVFSWETPFFIGLCIMKLVDQKKLSLTDKLGDYIPEYIHGDKITIHNMLKDLSGIKDYYHNHIMVELDKDDAYNALSGEDRLVYEKKIFHETRSFDQVIEYIKTWDLEYVPGTTHEEESASNWPLLAEIVRRVSGISIFDYLNEFLFKTLKMDTVKKGSETSLVSYGMFEQKIQVRMPVLENVDDLFTMMPSDIHKILIAFTNKKVFTKTLWKKMLKYDDDNNGLVFNNANGLICCNSTYQGYGAYMYFDQDKQLSFASMANEDQRIEFDGNGWKHYRKDFRETVSSLTTYPEHTKMVRLSKSNFWNVRDLSISKEQNAFVLDAKSSIGMALLYKTKKAYVQMEGQTIIGLLVLDIDKKKDNYSVDIIIIDKKFQGRGYGKKIVKYAVDELTKAGAKKLSIGVSRANPAAKQIYLNAGFKPHSIYEDGMELQLIIE